MTVENKKTVQELFEAINAQDIERADALMAEELSWWIIGRAKISGEKDRRLVRLTFKMLFRSFKEFSFTLHELTAEADRVAVTAESHGLHRNGKLYNNHYHFLFFFRDGKIVRVKEYFDTEHAIWLEAG
ncbi:MAG TPA: nuclear transport factor 2 family protein [Turneriella sp.]|nr:nuclear transport factor 2 family protein [Turneriella sp.]